MSELTFKLNELKKEIPYRWRIQSFSKDKPRCSCVAYIDARDAMDLLDSVVGPENWQDEYSVVNNQLVASVSIKCGQEWIKKCDTGTESMTEKEKGQFSDAFKRACVKWGIGRFLYNLDIVYLNTNGVKSESNQYPYVVDEKGQRVWDITEYINEKHARYNKND